MGRKSRQFERIRSLSRSPLRFLFKGMCGAYSGLEAPQCAPIITEIWTRKPAENYDFRTTLLIVTAFCSVCAQELAGGQPRATILGRGHSLSPNKGQTVCLSLVIIVRWKTTMRECIVFCYSVVDIIVDIIQVDSENCHILISILFQMKVNPPDRRCNSHSKFEH